jgi:Uma2 family endonuclease
LGYACFTQSPGKVRRADVSFVRRDRLPEVPTSDGYLYIAPDLAVEVISPNESLYKVDRKLREYLDAGVTLVWVVNPDARTVTIHRAHSVTRLQENEYLDGENVLPGFRCPVASIFPPKELGGLAASTN